MATKVYRVVAPLVIAKNADGSDAYIYQGGTVPDGQSDEWVAAHLESEMIATQKEADVAIAEATQTPGVDVPNEKPPARK